jgi:predicted GNAT family N-acyltransferase
MATALGPRDQIRIENVTDEAGLRQALAIREVVFIEEQHVPESVERDAEDERAFHVLCLDGGHAIGTGRLVELSAPPPTESGRWGQIGRMAVLQSHRRHGVGKTILDALEAEAMRRGLDGILLHAQVHAHDFYVRAGYTDHGPIFEEAGMPHVQMRKQTRASIDDPPGAKARSGSPASRGRAHRPARTRRQRVKGRNR